MKNSTTVERKSDRELVVSRTINGPARLVFEAWTKSELFSRWWVPTSLPMSLRSCELDVRVGGTYRLVFEFGEQTMDFFGTYLEVTPSHALGLDQCLAKLLDRSSKITRQLWQTAVSETIRSRGTGYNENGKQMAAQPPARGCRQAAHMQKIASQPHD